MSSAQRCKHCGYTREEHDDPSEFVPQELFTSNQRLECITLPNNSVVIDGTAYDHLAQVAQENVNLRAQLSCATAELAWAEECGRKRDAGETAVCQVCKQPLAAHIGTLAPGAIVWCPAKAVETKVFQDRVTTWAVECFGWDDVKDVDMRTLRFLEEALELAQACGCSKDSATQVLDYVYGRPSGVIAQEVGGTLVSLAVLCRAFAISMERCGEEELNRVLGKVTEIRARHAAKPKFGLPEKATELYCPVCLETEANMGTCSGPHDPRSWCARAAQKTSPTPARVFADADNNGLNARVLSPANAHDSWCLCSDCLDKRGREEAAEKTEACRYCLKPYIEGEPDCLCAEDRTADVSERCTCGGKIAPYWEFHKPECPIRRHGKHTPAAPDPFADKYHELLLAVGNKYPGESRHATALRYIRQAEAGSPECKSDPRGVAQSGESK